MTTDTRCLFTRLIFAIELVRRMNLPIIEWSIPVYKHVTSLTLIANQAFAEQICLAYLFSIVHLDKLRRLTIRFESCTQDFLRQLIGKCSNVTSLTLSIYQSWPILMHLSDMICTSHVRSLIVHEYLVNFNDYATLTQLFHRLEMISICLSSIDDCYRLLTMLFIGQRCRTFVHLRSLIIKCEFEQPNVIAHWLRTNILKKFSYKCTTSQLMMWL
jgi:hypothetical protein